MSATVNRVFEAQASFRAVMEAMARPGEIRRVDAVSAPPPLAPATAALLRSLADYETPVWLDPHTAQQPSVIDWLRFETGAPVTRDPREAAFAVVSDARALPALATFAQGTDEYPDRSTTIIAQVAGFSGVRLTLAGPGIKSERELSVDGLPDDLAERWAANRAMFPCGVDLVLVAQDQVAALPRTVRIVGKA